MMPVLRINDATFADLKSIAAWFGTKTPSETIDRVVRETMEQLGMERDDESEADPNATAGAATEFNTAPGLAFTKVLSASVNGKPIPKARWSTLLLATIAHLKAKGFESDKLVRELHVPAKAGQYDEDGYQFHPDLGVSVQGQSAAEAWKEVDRLARKWRIPVTVEFVWRQNPKAQYPGRTGVIRAGKV
jgi:hypothetical protein